MTEKNDEKNIHGWN